MVREGGLKPLVLISVEGGECEAVERLGEEVGPPAARDGSGLGTLGGCW